MTQGSDRARPDTESQGLATVLRPSGNFIRYTGFGTIPSNVRNRGWNHVGDPGSRRGFYIEPYQSDTIRQVTSLGSLPQVSSCSGNFETEGIDYDTRDGTLRVVMISPGVCAAFDSKTWRFKHR
ncbi:hypothetical protein [Kibdelosporangium aridum]|uniref:hypothetical protein n=1 Tax=Kibdelosporangium aridum TaxID=2030 RepID=UPI000567BFCF|nr:hypothetical protein [Kibdelosporangium aridum]